ncbi:MAG: hypothetical protein ACK5IJ_05950 [Mangrovibacterium sp.]
MKRQDIKGNIQASFFIAGLGLLLLSYGISRWISPTLSVNTYYQQITVSNGVVHIVGGIILVLFAIKNLRNALSAKKGIGLDYEEGSNTQKKKKKSRKRKKRR